MTVPIPYEFFFVRFTQSGTVLVTYTNLKITLVNEIQSSQQKNYKTVRRSGHTLSVSESDVN